MKASVTENSQRAQGLVLMVIVALIWASMPVAIKEIISSVPPAVQVAIRFTIGAVIFAPFARNLNLSLVRDGVILGLLMFASFVSETIALETIAANQASFIYGLLVIFVTLFEVVFYRRVSLVAILAAAIAFTGIGIMSWQNGLPPIGEVWMLICALLVSAIIIVLEILAPRHPLLPLTVVQLLVIAMLSWVWAAPQAIAHFEVISTNLTNPKVLVPLLYLGIVGTGLITWLQTKALSSITAYEAGLIETLDPVFGAMFAFFILGETFSIKDYIGAVMVIVGMILALSERKADDSSDIVLLSTEEQSPTSSEG